MIRSSQERCSSLAVARALRRTVRVTWPLALALLLVADEHGHDGILSSRLECGTNPLEILRIGEIVDPSTLHFVVDAHCTTALYRSDGSIGLRFRGAPVIIETRKLVAGGSPYYEIISIGGWRGD